MGMNIYKAINSIMDEIPAIGKSQKNAQQGFMYRGIDVVMNVLQPLLSKHKVFAVPEVLEHIREERQTKSGGNLIYSICKIKYTFYADDGSNVSAVVVGEGMDSGDKASNKAMAVAHKYAIIQVFAIPTEDEKDPENDSHDTVPSKPAVELVDETRKALVDRLVKLGDAISPADKESIRKTLKTLSTAELAPYVKRWEDKVAAVPAGAGVPDEQVPY